MFKTNRTPLILASTAIMALTLSACSSSDDSSSGEGGSIGTEFLTIATGSSSGVYYQVGATIADVLADGLGSDTSSQPTGGSVENTNLLASGDAELAIVSSDAMYYATEGAGPFEGEPIDGQQAIMTMFPNTYHLIAKSSAEIESIEDLRGKTVSVGDMGSGVELNTQAVLDAHDMSYDDISADFLSYAESAEQIANGHVDAMFASSGVPNPAVVELSTQTDITAVPIAGDSRDRVMESYPYFSPTSIPVDAYDNSEEVDTLGVVNHLLVSPELSEDAVYDITATIFDNLDRIQSSHAEASKINLEDATEGLATELHPGAQRYFEEQGIEIDQ